MTVTFTDIFCGAGGSSIGLTGAGFELALAANHWDWPLFDWWLDGMRQLDYAPQILCLNSAHAGGETNPHAPQWRDRLYVVFTRKGMPAPNLDPRPIAWCPTCDADVLAVQSWKKLRGRKVGKYRQQYVYRCPNFACRHSVIEPYVLPAAAAIDWSDLGQRIGDRARPLAAATMRRIRAGLELFAEPTVVRACGGDSPGRVPQARVWPAATEPLCSRLTSNVDGVAVPAGALVPAGGTWNDDPTGLDRPMRTRTAREAEGVLTPPVVVNVNHHGDDGRPYPAGAGPLAPRTTKIGDGIATTEPFVTMLRGPANRPTAVEDPLATVSTGNNHYLTTPEPFVTMLRNNNVARGVDDPLDTIAAGGKHHGLTVPPGAFYVKHFTPRGENWSGMSKDVRTEPFGAITSADHHSLVIPYRRGNRPRTTAEPLHTVSTHESAGLLKPTIEVEDCHFRMLKPREHLRAQRFPDAYVVLGNKGEQTMQAGNAVSSNVAHWIGERIAAVLGGAA